MIAHANGVIDRLVREYGVGYIKMDYNIEPGIGTEVDADSFGDGLLGHQRAYLQWLDSVFARYPGSSSKTAPAAACVWITPCSPATASSPPATRRITAATPPFPPTPPSALTPEQAAIWSYPLSGGEEVIFNMVNSMLLRIHQSGHLANLSPERCTGAGGYFLLQGHPAEKPPSPSGRWGSPTMGTSGSPWGSNPARTYVALWRRGSASPACTLPVKHLLGRQAERAASTRPGDW